MCNDGLGSTVARALASVGLTEERVGRWLDGCRCRERRERLNQLGHWARRVLRGRTDLAKKYLQDIMGGQ